MRKVLCISLFALILSQLSAQRTQIHFDEDKLLKEGIELYSKQQYAAAEEKFDAFLENTQGISLESESEAWYYQAACAVELFHENSEYLIKKFVEKFPESPKIAQANFLLGKVYFRNKDYKEAIAAFKQTDVFQLTREEYFEYYYKLGYSEFQEDLDDDALKHLLEVKDRENIYQIPAIYYFAHINYEKQNYEVALQHFLQIEQDKNFSKIVPYYIAQIYYFQKKYAEAIQYAEPIADTVNVKSEESILRILAESYFEIKNYEKSTQYFTRLEEKRYSLDRAGYYRAGQAYYQIQDYSQSVVYLQNVTTEPDSVTQTAYYYLADAYLHLNRKENALQSLKATWGYDFVPQIKQEAMYNYAKLSYELGYNPYNEAVDALEMYLNTYPNATNREEAYGLLVEIYMNTQNYQAALESLARIKNKNTKLKIAEQRLHYFRGVELFNNILYPQAIDQFNAAIEPSYEAAVAVEAKFWKGEAYYRQEMFSQAASTWQSFISMAEARNFKDYYLVYYNLGYAYLKSKEYNSALREFRSFADSYKGTDSKKLNDAYLRIGDCFFMNKSLSQAETYYQKAVDYKQYQVDYALLQKGIIQGIQQNYSGKFSTLTKAINEYPNSVYTDEITYELGVTCIRLGKEDEGVRYFEQIVAKGQSSAFLSKAYLQIGQVYSNGRRYEDAISWYQRVAEEFKGTSDARIALENIKSMCVLLGDVDRYTTILRNLDYADVAESSLDSLSYTAAVNLYENGNYDKAVSAFEKYIINYPSGIFLLEVNYYKGDCHYRKEEFDAALVCYKFIASKNKNQFSEVSLLRAGEITYTKQLYNDAIQYYTLLESFTGSPQNLHIAQIALMNAYFKINDYANAEKYATTIQSGEKLDESTSIRSNYVRATSLYKLGRYEEALTYYKKLKNTGAETYVEAQYYIADIYYKNGNYEGCQKQLYDHVSSMGSYYEWLGKAFLLLGDSYREQKNYAEARSVYTSIVQDHPLQEYKDLGNERIAQLDLVQNKNFRSTENPENLELNNEE